MQTKDTLWRVDSRHRSLVEKQDVRGVQTESPTHTKFEGRSISDTAGKGSDSRRRSVGTSVVKDFTRALAGACLSRSTFLTGNIRESLMSILRPSQ